MGIMAKTATYVELHARSAFSFLRAASLPQTLATRAAEIGLPALALCDRDGFYGCPRFWTAAEAAGIRAIYGCELTMEDGSVLPLLVRHADRLPEPLPTAHPFQTAVPKGESFVRWEELPEIADGVVCLTGDEEGPLVGALLRRDFARAESTLRKLLAVFGQENVYVEVQRHLRRGERWLNGSADRTGPHGRRRVAGDQRRALRRTRRQAHRGRVHLRATAHALGRGGHGLGGQR